MSEIQATSPTASGTKPTAVSSSRSTSRTAESSLRVSRRLPRGRARAVDAASKAFAVGRKPRQRESPLVPEGFGIVKRRRSEIAEVLARETGSTISFATFQQDLVAATLQQVAGWVFLPKGEVLETSLPGTHSIGVRRPLGVVASFTPGTARTSCLGEPSFRPLRPEIPLWSSHPSLRRSPRA